jgi:hypothetical protein
MRCRCAWVRAGWDCWGLDLIDLNTEFKPEADVNAKERSGALVLGPTMGQARMTLGDADEVGGPSKERETLARTDERERRVYVTFISTVQRV